MDPPSRKEKPKIKEPVSRIEKAKQKSAQQELKQRQRAEVSVGRARVPVVCWRWCWNRESRERYRGAPPASSQNRVLLGVQRRSLRTRWWGGRPESHAKCQEPHPHPDQSQVVSWWPLVQSFCGRVLSEGRKEKEKGCVKEGPVRESKNKCHTP